MRISRRYSQTPVVLVYVTERISRRSSVRTSWSSMPARAVGAII
jgi:hypothetical protein